MYQESTVQTTNLWQQIYDETDITTLQTEYSKHSFAAKLVDKADDIDWRCTDSFKWHWTEHEQHHRQTDKQTDRLQHLQIQAQHHVTHQAGPPTVWVKKIPPCGFLIFFPNGWEFLINFLHTYYMIISTLEYKFLFKYLQLWQSYAILSATT